MAIYQESNYDKSKKILSNVSIQTRTVVIHTYLFIAFMPFDTNIKRWTSHWKGFGKSEEILAINRVHMLSSLPASDSAAAAAAISPAMADAARSPTRLPSAAGEAVGGELRKRRRDWGSAAEEDGVSAGFDDGETSKRRGKPQDVVFRVVVPSRQIGRVIGKEGNQIRSIREDTRATIKIADAVSVSNF